MTTSLGAALYDMRTASGYSLGKLALKAGVSKAALSQWESEKRHPRVNELEAVLNALDTPLPQRTLILSHIEEPRGLRRLKQTSTDSALATPPSRGDLLRAMRIRKGWTQDRAAECVGVGRTAIVRWESGDRNPSNEQMLSLCFALGAKEAEVIALTSARGLGPSAQLEALPNARKAEWIEQRLQDVFWQRDPDSSNLWELEFLILEREAWALAVQDEKARALLSQVYAYHSERFRSLERCSEAAPLARRALALVRRQAEEPHFILRAAIVAAWVAVNSGSQISPERGVQLLRQWVNSSTNPDYVAWMLSDLSKYLMLAGYTDESLDLAKRAAFQAAESENPAEQYLRQMDHSRLLLQAGLPHGALSRLPEPTEITPAQYASDLLFHAEAHLCAGNRNDAHDWILRARSVVDLHSIEQERNKLAALSQRL